MHVSEHVSGVRTCVWCVLRLLAICMFYTCFALLVRSQHKDHHDQ